jgi:beta-N-acetylhexosaminidase
MRKWILIGLLLPLALKAQVDSLDIKIGQMIIMGLDDFTKLDKSEPMFDYIRMGYLGNVIVYGKHLDRKRPEKSLKEITSYIQEIAPIPIFISIDEEGGKVNRLKPSLGFPKTVSAQYLGTIDDEDSTRFYARATAQTLKRLGINMNFAPDVDLMVNPSNPVIAKSERSYSADMKVVSRHANFVIQEQKKFGVVNVLKHFPGHGSSNSDTHFGVADVSKLWIIEELYPYKALIEQGKVEAVMTAHIVNERLDPSRLPATLSKPIVNGILREFFHYEGVIISDDMQMNAISEHYGFEEAITLSINAGVDMIMFANNTNSALQVSLREIHGYIKKQVLNGSIPESRIDESYNRIMKLKKGLK